ncbi:hypothetical protein QOZ80_4BG0338110 [Eleusine coracana subsp. coracana]|nr:hypothetical protein QOZ80_4BG0338110 [Eleusine coracana subsp. coracana]
MAARGDQEARGSAQVEPAAAKIDLILLYAAAGVVKTVGKLHLRKVTSFGTLPLPWHADVQRREATRLKRGLYLAVSQGDEILDVASLSFMEGLPLAENGKAKAEKKDDKVGMEEHKAKEEADISAWKVEAEAKEGGGMDKEEEEVEDGGLDKEEEELNMWKEEQDGTNMALIRLWPESRRAVLILYRESRWTLTKAYHFEWLQNSMKAAVVELLNKVSGAHGVVTYKTPVLSAWSTEQICKMEFEGSLMYWADHMNLNPDHDQFEQPKLLGHGSDGSVYRCRLMNGDYALKVMKMSGEAGEPREIDIMSCLENPNIVVFYQAWCENKNTEYHFGETKDGSDQNLIPAKAVFIHMEWCSSNLLEVIEFGNDHLPMHIKWGILESITQGVKYLHQNGVLHRDLKPENVLIGRNNVVKIADFGHAGWIENYVGDQKCTPNRGTTLYRAPELNRSEINEKVDVYSIGVMALDIVPNFQDRMESAFAVISFMYGSYETEWDIDITFLKAATADNPSDRYSVDELLEYIVKQRKENAIGEEPDISSISLYKSKEQIARAYHFRHRNPYYFLVL